MSNFFNETQYECLSSFFQRDDSTSQPLIPLAIDYVIVLAFVMAFGLPTAYLVFVER